MKNQIQQNSKSSQRNLIFSLLLIGSFLLSGVHSIAQSITGPSNICVNATGSYTATPSGYTWSTSDSAVATINSGSGVATGISAGTVTLSYNKPGTPKTITITVNALPAISAGSGIAICHGSSTTLTATGGTTYSWSPSTGLSATTGASITANPTSTTTYSVTTTNASGCSNTATVTVTVNALPTISAGSGVAICRGSSTTLTATGGVTYSWTPTTGLSATTGANITANPLATTTYTVTGTNAAGCSASASKTVTVNALPSISAGSGAAICNGSSTTLTAGGGVSYSWSPSTGLSATTGASVTASPSINTTYTVSGTIGSGCSNTATVTVTVNAAPVISVGPAFAVCTGTATPMITASGGVAYSWSPATGLSSTTAAGVIASPLATTTYTVTGSNLSGCRNTATVTVTVNALPSISAGSGVAICNGASTTLTATGGSTYSWTPSTGLSATTGASISATPAITTTYSVTGTNAAGCSATASKTVTVNVLPSISAGSGVTVCNGVSSTLSATGGATYTWLPSTGLSATTGASVTAGPVSATTYTVTGTNGAGCSNIATVSVSVNPSPSVTTIGTGGAVCAGNTLTLNSSAGGGTGTLNYSWSGPGSFSSLIQNPSISSAAATASGVYSLTVTDANGCIATATTTATVNPMPSAGSITGANGVCMGSTTTLSDAAPGGVWSAGSSIVTVGSTTGVITGEGMGIVNITYTVTNIYTCSSMAVTSMEVSGIPQYLYTYTGTGTNATTGDGGPAYLANIQGPRAIATDTAGNLYISDVTANRIRKISANGFITTVAGNGTAGNTGDGGPATAAALNMGGGGGVYVDKAGNIYIASTASNVIRKVNVSTGIINTIAGTTVAGYSGDGGPATAAKLYSPMGMCEDTSGNMYFADEGTYRIRRIDAITGNISTIIGTGSNAYSGDGGPGTAARLSVPRDVCADKSGNLYIVDNGNNVIRKYVISTGIITTIAGTGTAGSTGDGGPAVSAELNGPARAAFDGSNNLYIADQGNNKIRQVNLATGIIKTAVATGTGGFAGDGGPSVAGELWVPAGVAFSKNGSIFVADANNRRIRVAPYNGSISISLSGPATVSAGTPVTFTACSSISNIHASFQWLKNGINVGTGGTTYTDPVPASGDVYSCLLDVTPDCGSSLDDTSNSITVLVAGARYEDTSATSVVQTATAEGIRIFPNPVHGQLNIAATGMENGTVKINIYDQVGRIVLSQTSTVTSDQLTETINMQSLINAVYIVEVTDASGKVQILKCVKN